MKQCFVLLRQCDCIPCEIQPRSAGARHGRHLRSRIHPNRSLTNHGAGNRPPCSQAGQARKDSLRHQPQRRNGANARRSNRQRRPSARSVPRLSGCRHHTPSRAAAICGCWARPTAPIIGAWRRCRPQCCPVGGRRMSVQTESLRLQ